MKIYLVRRKKTNVRWFDNEEDLTKFFINAPERLDSYQVTVLSAVVESDWTGDKLYDAIKEQSNIDRKLTVVLGDEYAKKVEDFLEVYQQKCPKTPWDKTKMTLEASKVYQKLTTVPAEEKQFSKVIRSCYDYLVYTIGSKWVDSSDWFKVFIDVYPKLATDQLSETCRTEYVDPVTMGTSWTGGRTPKNIIKSLEKAKKTIEKEKKKVVIKSKES